MAIVPRRPGHRFTQPLTLLPRQHRRQPPAPPASTRAATHPPWNLARSPPLRWLRSTGS